MGHKASVTHCRSRCHLHFRDQMEILSSIAMHRHIGFVSGESPGHHPLQPVLFLEVSHLLHPQGIPRDISPCGENDHIPLKPAVVHTSCPSAQCVACCPQQPANIGYTWRVIFENEFWNNAFNIWKTGNPKWKFLHTWHSFVSWQWQLSSYRKHFLSHESWK